MKFCKLNSLFFFINAFISTASFAQITNGSFENGSSPDLSGWGWTCGAESIESAPTGGGNWCIKVAGGNVKGCFPGYAYQIIPAITDGQSFTLSGWGYSQTGTPVGIYFGAIHDGTITTLAGDTTTATKWTPLSTQSNFTLSSGDTAVVVLFGGITAGPFQCFGYFDLVTLQETTGLQPIGTPHSISVSPNPFASETILTSDVLLKDASLQVYTMQGQLIRQANHISGETYAFTRGDLEMGLYLFQLTEANMDVKTIKVAITND